MKLGGEWGGCLKHQNCAISIMKLALPISSCLKIDHGPGWLDMRKPLSDTIYLYPLDLMQNTREVMVILIRFLKVFMGRNIVLKITEAQHMRDDTKEES